VARDGLPHSYSGTNRVNEYLQIGSQTLDYDADGNLSVDEEGRHYDYDEYNRLVEVRAADDTTVLAHFTYDALGRRVASKIGQTERHYYYAGQTVIEEYNVNSAGVESLARYHINGGQYIDERVVSYDVKSDGSAVPTYYLAGDNFSVIGTGSADGQIIRPLNYSPTGQFSGSGIRSCNLDQDSTNDVDALDFALLEGCFSGPDVPVTTGPTCQIGEAADIDRDGDVDGADYIIFQTCMSGTDVPASAACLGQGVSPEDSGIAAMHGLTVDVLPDGKALLYARARHYDMKHGRWLQRDPKGYVDGPNLYEAFGGNALRFLDPFGQSANVLPIADPCTAYKNITWLVDQFWKTVKSLPYFNQANEERLQRFGDSIAHLNLDDK